MDKKGEISTLKAWLIALLSLVDDIVVAGLIFMGLWLFHVKITLALILVIAAVMVASVFITYKAVIPVLRRRLINGAEGMIGAIGVVTEALDPVGMVAVKGEYWKASGVNGKIEKGREIEVVGIKGLTLEVKEKKSE